MAKKNNTKKAKNSTKITKANINNDDEFGKLIKLIVLVTVIFLVFYGITFLVNREQEEEETQTGAQIQYDNILIGDLLTQPNDEYYVMVYDSDDVYNVLYQTYLGLYASKEDAIRYYTADLDNPFNNSFVGEKANFEIKTIKDLKLNASTLLKIKDGKIKEHYVGEKLKEYLKEISASEED